MAAKQRAKGDQDQAGADVGTGTRRFSIRLFILLVILIGSVFVTVLLSYKLLESGGQDRPKFGKGKPSEPLENAQDFRSHQSLGEIDWIVQGTYHHDQSAFTQGLIWHEGHLFESTGLYGKSEVRRIDPSSGKILKARKLPRKYFGEGLTLWQDKLIQITWRSQKGFVFNSKTFDRERTFRFSTLRREGWGLTHNTTHLVVSDGSAYLFFWDPQTFREVSRVHVVDQAGTPIVKLNELEYVGKGRVLANVWYDPRLFLIDLASGRVLRTWDFASLILPEEKYGGEDCFNGIAFEPESGDVFLTGKLWAKMYRVKLPHLL